MKNKFFHTIQRGVRMLAICMFVMSCSDSDDIIDPTNPEEVKSILNSATKEWGIASDKIVSHMKGYNQLNVKEKGMLQFKVPNGESNISYQLDNNGNLCATVIMIPLSSAVSDINSLISGYSYVGELDGGKVYENQKDNTMAIIWQPIEYESTYTAIGFAPIRYNSFESILPISVTTTSEAKVEGYRATMSAKVSGVSSDVEVGFIYGMTPYLSEISGKKVSTTSHDVFTLEALGLIDDETYYYRPYAVVDGTYYIGKVKSFETDILTYVINGRTFNMIKVEGGTMPPFSMMQTEIDPTSDLQIGKENFGKMDCKAADQIMTKAELRQFIGGINEKTGLNFRLPTPNEWKFAASGGIKSKGYIYSGSDNISDVAWYSGNSEKKAHDIALKAPNELGFYDMSGNYAEICSEKECDVDGDRYGGYWNSSATNCKPTSYTVDPTAGNFSNSRLSNKNATDLSTGTVRLVYSRQEE